MQPTKKMMPVPTSISILLLLIITLFSSCSDKKTKPRTGVWRATLASPGGTLPFGMEIRANADSSTYTVHILNAEERFKMDTTTIQGDSIRIPIGLFEAEIVAKIEDQTLRGYWRKKRSEKVFVSLPFKAEFGKTYRFSSTDKNANVKVSGKWATNFYGKKDTTVAVGIFKQTGNRVHGTFLTPTGDYRYLEGNVVGDSLFLSTFDGTHVYLFKSKVEGEMLKGGFYSGVSSFERMEAQKDPDATLPDLKKLTYLKPGYNRISFSFPDQSGKKISLEDEKFKGKVVVVQIMGSWCPNCMDESKFLSPWYQKNHQRGVEIVGLAFEKTSDFAISSPKLTRMKKRFSIDYDVLLAGNNDKDSASLALPMLNRVVGFPTTIFIDKTGKVREIHTGFAGPGTGEYYDRFIEEFNRLIDKLLAE